MKKNIILSVVGVAAAGLLLASCSGKPEEVTAVVAGPDGHAKAVVVKYAKAVSAESVTADAFQIEGQEIEKVFVTDKDITAAPEKPGKPEKPECKGEKPECKGAECDSTKACPEAKPCPEGKPECDGKHEGCKKEGCDSTKVAPQPKPECEGPKSVDGQFVVIVLKKACPEEKPECKGAECDSTKACPEVAVPEISVKQVKDIKAADGSALKAWSKACPATKAVPCMKKGHKHHHHGRPGEKPGCPEGKPECDGQHKDCPKAK